MGAQDYEGLVSLYHGIFLYCGIAALVFLAAAILLFILLKIPRVFAELSGRVAKKAIAQMSEDGAVSGDLNTSRRIGEDGRRHRKGRTGALGTSKLRRKTGSLSGSLATEKMAADSGGLGGRSGQMGSFSGDLGSSSGGLGRPSGSLSEAPAMGGSPSGGLSASAGQEPWNMNGNAYASGDGSAPTDVLSNTGLAGDGFAPTDVLSSAEMSGDGSAPTDVLNSPAPAYPSGGFAPQGNTAVQENTPPQERGTWNKAYDPAQTETMVLGGGPVGFVVLRTIMEVHTDEVI